MTGKQRIMASLRGEQTDHLCWSPLIDAYFTSSLGAQGYSIDNVPDAVRLVGGDIMERHCPTVCLSFDDSIKRTFKRTNNIEIETIETPVGQLRAEKLLNKSITGAVIKHLIETPDDIKVYCNLLEHGKYREQYSEFNKWSAEIGEDGIATLEGPATPIQIFLQELCGVENTFYLLHDHTELMEDCFDMMHELNIQAYKLIAEGPGEVVIGYEDTSSTVISPLFYQKYCFPLIDHYSQILHDNNKLYLTHMCGKLKAFNEQMKTGLQDGIDSVCPPTTGDIWSYEAREAWGDEKVIIGGIEPPKLARMTVAETKAYVTDILDKMQSFRYFVLSTGDATSHGTPVENLLAVSEVVEEYPFQPCKWEI